MGAYNNYPVSVIPGHTDKISPPNDDSQFDQSDSSSNSDVMNEIDEQLAAAMGEGQGSADDGGEGASAMNPYPTPPNPCPLPYPDEEGKVKPFTSEFLNQLHFSIPFVPSHNCSFMTLSRI